MPMPMSMPMNSEDDYNMAHQIVEFCKPDPELYV